VHEDTVHEAAFANSQVICARLNTRVYAVKIYRHLKFCILVDVYKNMRCIQNAYNFGRSSLWRCVYVLQCTSSDCISLVLRSFNHTNHTVSLLLKHYSPLWTLAFNRIFPRSFRSLATLCQFLHSMSSKQFYKFQYFLVCSYSPAFVSFHRTTNFP